MSPNEDNKEQENNLVGKTIKALRPMTPEELETEGWDDGRRGVPVAIELDDGTVIYPARDEEGNGPGVLFGHTADGQTKVWY